MPPGAARPTQDPLPPDEAAPRNPLPKTPLVVMCLTFAALTLGLTLQVLFSPNDSGEMTDPARNRGVLQAEPHDEPTSRQRTFPPNAVIGAPSPRSAPAARPGPAFPPAE